MGLFGALFAGVSGLDSQSNKIGIISKYFQREYGRLQAGTGGI